jgi:hypothetical protein
VVSLLPRRAQAPPVAFRALVHVRRDITTTLRTRS